MKNGIVKISYIVLSVILFAGLLSHGAFGARKDIEKGKKEEVSIVQGKEVSLEYTLYTKDGKVVDTNVGKKPLIYTQGTRMIIPGLEKGLEGLKIGDAKKIEVPPEDGYGPVDKDAFQEVSKEKVPKEFLHVGAVIETRDHTGRVSRVRVVEIKDSKVVIDFNHPLAGKTLIFDVKVLDIKNPLPFE